MCEDCCDCYEEINSLEWENQKLEDKIDELQRKVEALAVENHSLSGEILNITYMPDDVFFSCPTKAQAVMGALVNLKTPATDAALAEIRAQGVELLIAMKLNQLENMHPDTHAFGAQAMEIRTQVNEMMAFANQLRKESGQ